jgi:hypothetical protein
MSVPIQEAAEALVPLLSAGADVAARELAGQAGSSFSRAALRLIGKIRDTLKSPNPDVAEVENALRTGLADGTVSASEIQAVVSVQRSDGDIWNVSAGRDANIKNTLHVEGDYEA